MNRPLDLAPLETTLRLMKSAHRAAGPAEAALRRDRLARAARLLVENRADIAQAVSADFGHRSPYQTLAADIAGAAKSLHHGAENVARWMQSEPIADPEPGMRASIDYQPLGVIGIISPWNFPVNLAFSPLAGVFAAGNVAMLKPSELTPRVSELLAELIARYFDANELSVALGDASVGAAFSRLPFDHLIFTGSGAVGREVMKAAAEHLTPVTLELGGKSPVVLDSDADPRLAAQRVLTAKTFNAGQICISPDYVMLGESQCEAFVAAARAFMAEAYPTLQANADYTSIVSARHYQRLLDLIEDARVLGATVVSLAPRGEPDAVAATRKIAPTLILNVSDDMRVMREEIFGPVLPVKCVRDLAAAIDWINDGPRPLASYFFGDNEASRNLFAARVTSGALVVNDVMTHVSIEELPFGGVGPSGMGAYHGLHGFRRFSHARPVVIQNESGASGLRLRAPYAEKLKTLEAALGA